MKGDGIRFITAANCDVLPPLNHRSQGEDPAVSRRSKQTSNSEDDSCQCEVQFTHHNLRLLNIEKCDLGASKEMWEPVFLELVLYERLLDCFPVVCHA